MKKISLISLLLPFFSIVYLHAQTPDYELEELFPVDSLLFVEKGIKANVSVYSDGKNITVVAEVWDKNIQIDPVSLLGDHIILWFALPQSVYPDDFDFHHHPNYILSQNQVARGKEGFQQITRLFSVFSEYSRELEIDKFVHNFDYPFLSEENTALEVPPPYHLHKDLVPFGLVKFGLFPDHRPATLYHARKYRNLEEVLHESLGDFSEGIRYTVDYMDENAGYVINAEISPQALGFVTLPELKEIGFMMEVVDSGTNMGEFLPVLRSTPSPPTNLASFQQVRLQRPLYTNFTGIPDWAFIETGLKPLQVLGKYKWMTVKVDTDALVLSQKMISNYLSEIQFRPMRMVYEQLEEQGFSIEKLLVQDEFVNLEDKQRTYFKVANQVIEIENPLGGGAGPLEEEMYFKFPDGQLGIVVAEKDKVDQYGWGTCEDCHEDRIIFYKIGQDLKEKILVISQGNKMNYCQVGSSNFDNYAVSKMDWVEEGRKLVLFLEHRENLRDRKRLIVSWNDKGKDLLMEGDR